MDLVKALQVENQILKQSENEIYTLKQKVHLLEQENSILKDKVNYIESKKEFFLIDEVKKKQVKQVEDLKKLCSTIPHPINFYGKTYAPNDALLKAFKDIGMMDTDKLLKEERIALLTDTPFTYEWFKC